MGMGMLHLGCSALLDQVDLGAGHCAGGDEGTMLGTDEVQAALGCVGPVLSRLQFPLETAHAGHALAGYSFL